MTGPQQQQTIGSSRPPGQMTAMMRRARPVGPKVLRIGVVQAGRIVEERIIKQRTHVSVGLSEKNLFVVSSPLVPPSYRMFELLGGDYHLNFLEGMQGRIALPTGIVDLSLLKGQTRRTSQGYQIRLSDDARGKIVVGDTAFLFQFVVPPPVQPRPRLPAAVLRGGGSIDWNTAIITAFSFLFHFLLLGAVYSDWLDPVVDDELAVAGLIDSLESLPPPPEVEEKAAESASRATIGGAGVTGGVIRNVAAVVARLDLAFRECHELGLLENPDAQGNIRLTLRVGPGGEVIDVSAVPAGKLPRSVVECVRARASAAQFDPPDGGSAAVQVPVTFVMH